MWPRCSCDRKWSDTERLEHNPSSPVSRSNKRSERGEIVSARWIAKLPHLERARQNYARKLTADSASDAVDKSPASKEQRAVDKSPVSAWSQVGMRSNVTASLQLMQG